MDIPFIEQAKIQAQVLVPLLKALQAELGEERANAILRNTLGEFYRKLGQDWWRALGPGDLGEKMDTTMQMFSSGDALDYEVIKQTPDAYEFNVTGCRYAKFYKGNRTGGLALKLSGASFGDSTQRSTVPLYSQGHR